MKERNQTIDIMRLIGLLLIILAHTISPQTLIFQLRNFDVPMMVIISGMSFFLSNENKKIDLKSYYIKRIIRLLFPTWIFLSILFIITYFISILNGSNFLFDGKVLGTFLLFQGQESIGYVWIIRVFLLVAIINPLLYILYKKFNKLNFTIFLLIAYLFYSLIIFYFPFSGKKFYDIFIHQYIYYLIPYGILSGFGMLLINFKLKHKLFGTGILFFLLVGTLLYKYGIDNFKFFPQDFKYPARDYYLLWGLFVTFSFTLILGKIKLNGIYKKSLYFFSSYSLWLYFRHIVVLIIINNNLNINNGFKKFITVLFITIIIMYLHKLFFTNLLKITNKKIQKNIKILFLI